MNRIINYIDDRILRKKRNNNEDKEEMEEKEDKEYKEQKKKKIYWKKFIIYFKILI